MQIETFSDMIQRTAVEIKPDGEFFILKSGAKSRFYIDLRKTHLTPGVLNEVVNRLWARFQPLSFDAFGGPSLGADPIIGGLTYLAGMMPALHLCGFLVRPEAKAHGTGNVIEGPLKAGMKVVIVEDVVTTGGSTLKTIDAVEKFGCQVVHIFAVLDRLEGAAQRFSDRGIPFTALLTVENLNLK